MGAMASPSDLAPACASALTRLCWAGVGNSKFQRRVGESSWCCGPAHGMLLVGSIHPAPWWLLHAGKLPGDIWVKVPSGCWGAPQASPALAHAQPLLSLPPRCHVPAPWPRCQAPHSCSCFPAPAPGLGGTRGTDLCYLKGAGRPKGFSLPQGAGGERGKPAPSPAPDAQTGQPRRGWSRVSLIRASPLEENDKTK